MKKILILLITVTLFMAACASAPPENPGRGPELSVEIPELFSPDPDKPNDTMTIAIKVSHPVPIKEWSIQIQPSRGESTGQRQAGDSSQRQGREGGQRQAGQEERRRASSRPS